MNVQDRITRTVLFFALLFVCGMLGGYLFLKADLFHKDRAAVSLTPVERVDYVSVRVYYPHEGGLQMEERAIARVTTRQALAETTVREYLKGPSGEESPVPRDAKLLGVYSGTDGVLYVDLSDEFRIEFQGDALSEFLLLRGLYESLLSNVQGLGPVKVLIEGKEVETLGGHISLIRPLGESVAQTVTEEDE